MYCSARLERELEKKRFRNYVTTALHAISENTAVPASYFTEGKMGRIMVSLDEKTEPVREETRTEEEIINHVFGRLEEVRKHGSL